MNASIEHVKSNPLGFAQVPEGVSAGPDCYALAVEGEQLSPQYQNGDVLLCDPDAMPEPGDFVAVWWRDSKQPSVKRLTHALPPGELGEMDWADALLVCEQLNPPKTLAAPLSQVAAVHRVVARLDGTATTE